MKKLLLSVSFIVLATSPSFAENSIAERKVSGFLRPTTTFSKKKIRHAIAEHVIQILLGKHTKNNNLYGFKNKSDENTRQLDELLEAYENDMNLNLPEGEQKNGFDHLKMTGEGILFSDVLTNFVENIKDENEKNDLRSDLKDHLLENAKNSFQVKTQEISENRQDGINSFRDTDINTQLTGKGEGNQSSKDKKTFTLDQQIGNEENNTTSVAERTLGFERLKLHSFSENYSDYADYMANFLGLFLDILSNFKPKTAHDFFETYSILRSLYSDYLSSSHVDQEVADTFAEAMTHFDNAIDEIKSAENNGTDINVQEIGQRTVGVVYQTIQKTVTNVVAQISQNLPHVDVDDQTATDINIIFNEKESAKTSIEKVLLNEIKSYKDLENLVKHYVKNQKTQEELLTILQKAQHHGNSLATTHPKDQKIVAKDPNIEKLDNAYKKAGLTEDVPQRTALMLSDALKNNKDISSLLSELKTSILKSAGSELETGKENFYKMMEHLQKEYSEKGDMLTAERIEKYVNQAKIEDNLLDFSKISFTEKKNNISVSNGDFGSPPPPPPPPGDFGSPPPPPPPGFSMGGLSSLSTSSKIINDLPKFYSENIIFDPKTRSIEMTDGAIKKLLDSEFQRFIDKRKTILKNALLTKNLSHTHLNLEQQKIDKLTINLNKEILNREFAKGTDNLSIKDIKTYTQLIEILNLASGNFVLGERPLFETTDDYQKFVTGLILPMFENINPITIQGDIEDCIHDQVSRIIQNGTIEDNWDSFLVQKIEQKIKISGKKDTIGKLLLQTRKTTSQSKEEFESFILGKSLNSLEDFTDYVAKNVKGITDKKEIGNQFKILEEAKKETLKKTSSKKEKIIGESENLTQDPFDIILNQAFIECGIDQENVDNCIKTQSRALFVRAIHKGGKWDDIIGFLPEIEKAFMSIPETQEKSVDAPMTQAVKKERDALYKFLDVMANNISEKSDLFNGAKLELKRQDNLLEIHSLKFYTPKLITISTEIDNSIDFFPPPPPPMPGSDLGNTGNSTDFPPPPPPPPSSMGMGLKLSIFDKKSLNEVMKNVKFVNEQINIEENLFKDLIGNWLRLRVEKNGSDFDVSKFIKLNSKNFEKINTFEDFTNLLREIISDRTLTKCKVPVFDNSSEVIEDAIALAKGFIIGKVHESRFDQNPEKAIEEYFRNDLGRIGDAVSKNRQDHVALILSENLKAKSAKTRETLKEFSQKFINEALKQLEKEEGLIKSSSVKKDINLLDN